MQRLHIDHDHSIRNAYKNAVKELRQEQQQQQQQQTID